MLNLLPTYEKKRIKREYILRVVIIGLIFLCVLGFIASVTLLPSYVIVWQRIQTITTELDSITSTINSEDSIAFNKKLKQTNKNIEVLAPNQKHIPLYVLINDVLRQKSNSIQISGITYTHKDVTSKNKKDDTENEIVLTVSGSANNRESLIDFQNVLRNISYFNEVTLPVSNLASRNDITFSLETKSRY